MRTRHGAPAAWTAAGLAGLSTAVSLFWLVGGTLGLRSLGGGLEDLARERSPGALALLATVVAAKAVAAVLAALLARPAPRPAVRWCGLLGGAVLAAYGGLLVAVGALVLLGVVPAPGADRYALAWHVGLWDLWFLVWGVAWFLAARAAAASRAQVPLTRRW